MIEIAVFFAELSTFNPLLWHAETFFYKCSPQAQILSKCGTHIDLSLALLVSSLQKFLGTFFQCESLRIRGME